MPRTNRNIPEPKSIGRAGQTAGTLPPTWKPSVLVAVPLPIVIVSVAVFNLILPPPAQFNKGLAFEPPFLNAILYTIFLALTSFIVAYISFKSYIQNGLTFLVLLGSGALAWGSTSLLAGWLTNLPAGPNPAITISNTGALVASIFHIVSGAWSRTPSPQKSVKIRRSIIILAYGGVLSFTALYSIAALEGVTLYSSLQASARHFCAWPFLEAQPPYSQYHRSSLPDGTSQGRGQALSTGIF